MGIGVGEGLLLLLIAALFLKGDEFSTVARKAGQWMGQAQRMSRGFMDELQREADRSGLADSTREIRNAMKSAKSNVGGNPLQSLLGEDMESEVPAEKPTVSEEGTSAQSDGPSLDLPSDVSKS